MGTTFLNHPVQVYLGTQFDQFSHIINVKECFTLSRGFGGWESGTRGNWSFGKFINLTFAKRRIIVARIPSAHS